MNERDMKKIYIEEHKQNCNNNGTLERSRTKTALLQVCFSLLYQYTEDKT